MKTFFFILLLAIGTPVFAQDDYSENTFFFDVNPFGNVGYGGGGQIKVGNTWHLSKFKKNKPFIPITWFGAGFVHQDGGTGFILTTPQLGFGYHFYLNEKIAVDPIINIGVSFISDDVLHPSFDRYYFIRPQVKFHFGSFTIGADYSPSVVYDDHGSKLDGIQHLVGINIGFTFDSFGFFPGGFIL